ncbi:hypothetical protein BH23GEM5_BH23GEM5_25650 [soil metagenome]
MSKRASSLLILGAALAFSAGDGHAQSTATPAPVAAPEEAAAPATAPSAAPKAKAPRRNRDVISADEIREVSQTDAMSLVQALRPGWLSQRGKSSMSRPEYLKVYRDGMPVGGAGALRQIAVDEITSIQYFDGISATQRWGTDHGNGAILVRTR